MNSKEGDLSFEEIIKRVKRYHDFQDERKKQTFSKFSGNKLSFKGVPDTGFSKTDNINWFSGLKRSEKSKYVDIKRNQKLLEIEEERKEKAKLKKRLLGAHKVKNVSIISPSTITTVDDDIFETVHVPTNEEPITPSSSKCFLRVKLLDGSTDKVQFQSENKLKTILEFVITKNSEKDHRYTKGLTLQTTYPVKKFNLKELISIDIKTAGLINGSVSVIIEIGGFVMKEVPFYQYEKVKLPTWRLKADSKVEKDRFKKKKLEEKMRERKKDKKREKNDLKRIRKKIEKDREKRRKERLGIKDDYDEILRNKKKKGKRKKKLRGKKNTEDLMMEKIGLVSINFRLPQQVKLEENFGINDNLKTLEKFLLTKGAVSHGDDFSFVIPYPRRVIKKDSFARTKVKDLGISGRSVVIVSFPKNILEKKEVPINEKSRKRDLSNRFW